MDASGQGVTGKKTARTIAAFFIIVCVWVFLDQLTKSFFASMSPGGILAGPYAGLVDIRLVHNTGGAWGIFAGNTTALGMFSLVVCAILTVYFIWQRNEVNIWQAVGIAIIVAGGIGNAIDRFVQGYVVDFIEFSFVDFPVFNVADIGVTCGFALLFIGIFVSFGNEKKDGS